ncbi:hypothetical protein C8J57DRAFT_1518826 [Mycena rebaudengoi]|nr:hypothetical protein C8J57DRAFT_1518826 [Mycena rebaudengoi]
MCAHLHASFSHQHPSPSRARSLPATSTLCFFWHVVSALSLPYRPQSVPASRTLLGLRRPHPRSPPLHASSPLAAPSPLVRARRSALASTSTNTSQMHGFRGSFTCDTHTSTAVRIFRPPVHKMRSNPNLRPPAPHPHPQPRTSPSRLPALLLFVPASVHHRRVPVPVLLRSMTHSVLLMLLTVNRPPVRWSSARSSLPSSPPPLLHASLPLAAPLLRELAGPFEKEF